VKRPRVTPESACEWLQEQLDDLDQFRNASTRDAQFKQWRQSTLTVIHRIWPGVTVRSRRFRRVPFSPPSTLADGRQIRESYERGCAEANQLLRAWITEIQSSGIQTETAESVAPVSSDEIVHGSPTLTLEGEAPQLEGADLLEHGVPTIDLPAADSGSAPASGKSPRAGASRKSSKAKAPSPAKSAKTPAAKAEPAAKTEPSAKAEPVERAEPAAEAQPAAAKPSEKGGRLKDMLGFGHLAASSGGPDESKRLEAVPDPAPQPRAAKTPMPKAVPGAPSRPPSAPAAASGVSPVDPFGAVDPFGPPRQEPGSEPDSLIIEMVSPSKLPPPGFERTAAGERPPLRPFEGSPLDIPGFTRSAPPVPGSTPSMSGLRPPPPLDLGFPEVPRTPTDMERLDVADLELTVVNDSVDAPPPVVRHANPAGAAEIVAIANEIPRLDVPASECERVKRTLLDLAHVIERGEPSWDALRAATAIVMHYPKLGRRAMPVLLPFLDHTA